MNVEWGRGTVFGAWGRQTVVKLDLYDKKMARGIEN